MARPPSLIRPFRARDYPDNNRGESFSGLPFSNYGRSIMSTAAEWATRIQKAMEEAAAAEMAKIRQENAIISRDSMDSVLDIAYGAAASVVFKEHGRGVVEARR